MKPTLLIVLSVALAACSLQVRQQTPLRIGLATPVPTATPTLTLSVYDAQWEWLVVQGWRVYIRECANTSCAPIQPVGILEGGQVVHANCSYRVNWCMVDNPHGWVWAPCLGKYGGKYDKCLEAQK